MRNNYHLLNAFGIALVLIGLSLFSSGCEIVQEALPIDIKATYNGMDLLSVAYQAEIKACEQDSLQQRECDTEELKVKLAAIDAERVLIAESFEAIYGEEQKDSTGTSNRIGLLPIGPSGPVPVGPPPPPSPCQCRIPWEEISLFFTPGAGVTGVHVLKDGRIVSEGKALTLADGKFSTFTIDLTGFKDNEVAQVVMQMENGEISAYLGQ